MLGAALVALEAAERAPKIKATERFMCILMCGEGVGPAKRLKMTTKAEGENHRESGDESGPLNSNRWSIEAERCILKSKKNGDLNPG